MGSPRARPRRIGHVHAPGSFPAGMPFQITTTITCFLLPGDGAQAEAEFLHHLADPSEMYIIAYGFTLQPMIDQFLANHAAGDPLHIYLDHSQASGNVEDPTAPASGCSSDCVRPRRDGGPRGPEGHTCRSDLGVPS